MRDRDLETLERLEVLASRYVQALGTGEAPLPRGRGVHVVSLEWELVQLWQRFPDPAELVAWTRTPAATEARPRAERLAACIRQASAALWKARGRVAKRMGQHPDVLQPLRHAVAALKEAFREAPHWAPAPSLAA